MQFSILVGDSVESVMNGKLVSPIAQGDQIQVWVGGSSQTAEAFLVTCSSADSKEATLVGIGPSGTKVDISWLKSELERTRDNLLSKGVFSGIVREIQGEDVTITFTNGPTLVVSSRDIFLKEKNDDRIEKLSVGEEVLCKGLAGDEGLTRTKITNTKEMPRWGWNGLESNETACSLNHSQLV